MPVNPSILASPPTFSILAHLRPACSSFWKQAGSPILAHLRPAGVSHCNAAAATIRCIAAATIRCAGLSWPSKGNCSASLVQCLLDIAAVDRVLFQAPPNSVATANKPLHRAGYGTWSPQGSLVCELPSAGAISCKQLGRRTNKLDEQQAISLVAFPES